jgi:ElaB/YqjD/DUF883 family membrane-anchored ribosome-binding protein
MEMTRQSGALRERLLDDLKLIIQDADYLLRSTGQQVDEGYRQARARFESTLSDAKDGLSTLETRVTTSARDAADSTQEFVQENPWQAVGIGALAGLVVGVWLGRR